MDLLKDSIKKLYFRYLFPSMGSAVVASVYLMTDAVVIGKGIGNTLTLFVIIKMSVTFVDCCGNNGVLLREKECSSDVEKITYIGHKCTEVLNIV